MTLDQLALDALLDSDAERRERRLFALALLAGRLHSGGECPECGDPGPHEDNGRSVDTAFCCRACGTHFDLSGGAS